jgi:hypothetical protein
MNPSLRTLARAASAASLVFATACGRLGFASLDAAPAMDAMDDAVTPDAATLDAGTPDAVAPDAAMPAADAAVSARPTLCGFASGQWHLEASLVAAASSRADEGESRLSADGLTLFFARFGDGTFALRRARLSDPFAGPLTMVQGVGGSDVGLAPERTGPFAWVARDQAGLTRRHDIWRMTRTMDAPITYAFDREETALNSDDEEYDPAISSDALRLYYVSPRPGFGQEILMASRASVAQMFGAGVVVAGLSSTAHEDNPTFTDDETVVVFGRIAATAGAQKDLFVARRGSHGEAFGPAIALSEINTSREETETFLRSDGCELFFSRNDGPPDQLELYRAVVVAGPPR